ncbi:MAG: hypothetical protein HQL29_05605 [Candidatus Omnitrophica bacterium]|nr:hypothetical protein [Candidatus Omnitrophota bacterium]
MATVSECSPKLYNAVEAVFNAGKSEVQSELTKEQKIDAILTSIRPDWFNDDGDIDVAIFEKHIRKIAKERNINVFIRERGFVENLRDTFNDLIDSILSGNMADAKLDFFDLITFYHNGSIDTRANDLSSRHISLMKKSIITPVISSCIAATVALIMAFCKVNPYLFLSVIAIEGVWLMAIGQTHTQSSDDELNKTLGHELFHLYVDVALDKLAEYDLIRQDELIVANLLGEDSGAHDAEYPNRDTIIRIENRIKFVALNRSEASPRNRNEADIEAENERFERLREKVNINDSMNMLSSKLFSSKLGRYLRVMTFMHEHFHKWADKGRGQIDLDNAKYTAQGAEKGEGFEYPAWVALAAPLGMISIPLVLSGITAAVFGILGIDMSYAIPVVAAINIIFSPFHISGFYDLFSLDPLSDGQQARDYIKGRKSGITEVRTLSGSDQNSRKGFSLEELVYAIEHRTKENTLEYYNKTGMDKILSSSNPDKKTARLNTYISHMGVENEKMLTELIANAQDASIGKKKGRRFGKAFFQTFNFLYTGGNEVVVETSTDGKEGVKIYFWLDPATKKIMFNYEMFSAGEIQKGTIVSLKGNIADKVDKYKEYISNKLRVNELSEIRWADGDEKRINNPEEYVLVNTLEKAIVPGENEVKPIKVLVNDNGVVIADQGKGMSIKDIFEKLLLPQPEKEEEAISKTIDSEITRETKLFYKSANENGVDQKNSTVTLNLSGYGIEDIIIKDKIGLINEVILAFPHDTEITSEKSHIALSGKLTDSIKGMKILINKLTELDRKIPLSERVGLINVLAEVIKIKQKNEQKGLVRGDAKTATDLLWYLQYKVNEVGLIKHIKKQGKVLLPNDKGWENINDTENKFIYIDRSFYDFGSNYQEIEKEGIIEKIELPHDLSYKGEKLKVYIAALKDNKKGTNATMMLLENDNVDNILVIDKDIYEKHKEKDMGILVKRILTEVEDQIFLENKAVVSAETSDKNFIKDFLAKISSVYKKTSTSVKITMIGVSVIVTPLFLKLMWNETAEFVIWNVSTEVIANSIVGLMLFGVGALFCVFAWVFVIVNKKFFKMIKGLVKENSVEISEDIEYSGWGADFVGGKTSGEFVQRFKREGKIELKERSKAYGQIKGPLNNGLVFDKIFTGLDKSGNFEDEISVNNSFILGTKTGHQNKVSFKANVAPQEEIDLYRRLDGSDIIDVKVKAVGNKWKKIPFQYENGVLSIGDYKGKIEISYKLVLYSENMGFKANVSSIPKWEFDDMPAEWSDELDMMKDKSDNEKIEKIEEIINKNFSYDKEKSICNIEGKSYMSQAIEYLSRKEKIPCVCGSLAAYYYILARYAGLEIAVYHLPGIHKGKFYNEKESHAKVLVKNGPKWEDKEVTAMVEFVNGSTGWIGEEVHRNNDVTDKNQISIIGEYDYDEFAGFLYNVTQKKLFGSKESIMLLTRDGELVAEYTIPKNSAFKPVLVYQDRNQVAFLSGTEKAYTLSFVVKKNAPKKIKNKEIKFSRKMNEGYGNVLNYYYDSGKKGVSFCFIGQEFNNGYKQIFFGGDKKINTHISPKCLEGKLYFFSTEGNKISVYDEDGNVVSSKQVSVPSNMIE